MRNKLIDKLIMLLGATGLISLVSCATIEAPRKILEIQKEIPFSEQIGNYLFGYLDQEGVTLGYDTDRNGIEDTRLHYTLVGIDEKGIFHFQLYGISKDKNRNGKFEEGEFEFINVEKEYAPFNIIKYRKNLELDYIKLNK